jgi:excisionase family DNA binding protein
MNKQQAAEYLNVSTRAVERYTSKGKLTPRYEKGRTGPAPIFEQQQLDALKAEMEQAATAPPPVVQHDKPAKSGKSDKGDKGDKGDAMMIRSGNKTDLAAFIAAIESARLSARPVVSTENKLTLALTEASALSGLSRAHLLDAIHTGKLKAKIIGRGWRISRDHLKTYTDKLFR